jgi:hypothetical protein
MSSFFKRWSSLKTENSVNKAPAVEAMIAPEVNQAPVSSALTETTSSTNDGLPKDAELVDQTPSVPQLADVQNLTTESDYSVFMNKEVAGEVHQAAMKKLFTDPHFNIMDGLDIYIDDYSIEDPLPAGMLEKMYQSDALGLFKPILETTESKDLSAADESGPVLKDEDHLEAIPDRQAKNASLISHQEQFEFTLSNSIEPTQSVEQEATDLINTEVMNKDDHTRV